MCSPETVKWWNFYCLIKSEWLRWLVDEFKRKSKSHQIVRSNYVVDCTAFIYLSRCSYCEVCVTIFNIKLCCRSISPPTRVYATPTVSRSRFGWFLERSLFMRLWRHCLQIASGSRYRVVGTVFACVTWAGDNRFPATERNEDIIVCNETY